MPQYRAVRAFGIDGKGKYGHVRAGVVVTMSESEAKAFNRVHPKENPILVPHSGPAMGEPIEPSRTGGQPGAPFHSDDDHDDGHGEDDPHADRDDGRDEDDDANKDDEDLDGEGEDEGNESSRTEEPTQARGGQRGGGRGKQSSASRQGRASRRRT